MYFSPLISLFLLSSLFNLNLAAKVQQLQQQCQCDPSGPVIGTSCPVPPLYDDNCNLDPSKVSLYGKMLQGEGFNGITVNAPQMGSLALTLEQKMQVIRTWCEYKKSNGFPYTMTCHVGETDFNDTIKLAEYAKRSCCDIIECGPPLYYPPKDINELVTYLKPIAKACYPKPFMYADLLYPECEFNYNTPKLFVQLSKMVDNFYGIKSDFETCLATQSINQDSSKVIVSESAYAIAGAYAFCLNGTSATIANVLPKQVVQIQQLYLAKDDCDGGVDVQKEVSCFLSEILDIVNRPERVDRSELIYEILAIRAAITITTGIDVGPLPGPFTKLSREIMIRIYEICEKYGYATKYPYDDNIDYNNNNNNKNKYPKGNKNKGTTKGWGNDRD